MSNSRRDIVVEVLHQHIDTADTFEDIGDEVIMALDTKDIERYRQVDAVLVAFNDFIKEWVAPQWHGHLLDYDDNAGERLRELIRNLT